jgi:transcriptional regulator with XRE-family HTH domain
MSEALSFPEWITKTRNQKGWTTGELAQHSGLSTHAIWQYESGMRTRNPRPEALAKIARALDYPPEFLWKLAGIVISDDVNEETALIAHIVCLVKELPPEERNVIAGILEYLVAKRDRGRSLE